MILAAEHLLDILIKTRDDPDLITEYGVISITSGAEMPPTAAQRSATQNAFVTNLGMPGVFNLFSDETPCVQERVG